MRLSFGKTLHCVKPMIGHRTFTNKTRSEDIQCIIMGRLGFSVLAISERTGLTKHAVNYRLRLLGVKLRDYRNGHSDLSQRIQAAATTDANHIVTEIRKYIKDHEGTERKDTARSG